MKLKALPRDISAGIKSIILFPSNSRGISWAMIPPPTSWVQSDGWLKILGVKVITSSPLNSRGGSAVGILKKSSMV